LTVARTFAYTFEWGPNKAVTNRRKHGISFEQAATVFRDRLMLSIPDTEHSEQEERWVTLGRSEDGKLLVVIHTYQETSEQEAVVRVISAREATQPERQHYEHGP
jgi:uncharacterized protein